MPSKTHTLAASIYVITSFGLGSAAAEPLKVVATFSILGDFAIQVGGDRIELTTLVGPDADAHVYEPRPADAMALARADIVLTNGLLFEGFLSRLIEASGTAAQVVELTDGATILADPDGGHYHHSGGEAVFHAAPNDPHAWQSVANAMVYVRNVADGFCEVDAEGCETYRANAERYLGELEALDAEIRAGIEAIPDERRAAVVAHNAFRYFEEAYGLAFLSPQGVSTDSEASAADVAGLVRQMRERAVLGVFAENISDSRLVQRIADEAGLEIAGTLYSDALSPPDGPAPTYLDLMRHNLTALRSGL